MAILSEQERAALRSSLAQALSRRFESVTLTKSELKAAVDAADQWVENNKVAFNNALPVAAQAGLTTSQKAELLLFVVRHRFDVEA